MPPLTERPIRFGIPSLDGLLGRRPSVYEFDFMQENRAAPSFGIDVTPLDTTLGSAERESLTIAIIGTDGTSKSILAMHLAAYSLADTKLQHSVNRRVLYASTDLSFGRAAPRGRIARSAIRRPGFQIPSTSRRAKVLHSHQDVCGRRRSVLY